VNKPRQAESLNYQVVNDILSSTLGIITSGSSNNKPKKGEEKGNPKWKRKN
jgi:hypothetical protein